MRKILLFTIISVTLLACKNSPRISLSSGNKNLANVLDEYYEDRLKLFPLEATYAGDNRYNDVLPNDGSAAFIAKTKDFYTSNLEKIKLINRDELNDDDKLSYDIFTYEMDMALDGLKYHFEYLPFNQFFALTLTMGQLGSGSGAQPFKTVKDYDNWLKRVNAFKDWADTAKANFDKGIKAGNVLPKALVVKMIPQMESMVVASPEKSFFYNPVKLMPKSFSAADKQRITNEYKNAISNVIVPTYQGLATYLKETYLPHARSTSGFGAVANGPAMYLYLVRQQTTTNKTPDEIYDLGLSEVKRIRTKMDSIKNAVGFKGDLKAFFEYMKTDARFMPYRTPGQVLAAFENIHKRMEPQLKKMFSHVPKTPFEIRQTEAFRAASASAEYNPGSADGSRPGIFYVPILDAAKFNTTSGMESLFLHEAIPGHHYQISLTQENTNLPKFRRFRFDNAYAEGWALYCESLGKELGLYTDPYQYMGALGDEIHRAIRLVVDVAIHAKGMTREQAIKYMMDNEAISEQGATAEIERYMAIPGQALGYKIGALKIREMRTRAEKALGSKFNLAEFHNQVLKDGSVPLAVFEDKIDAWIALQQKQ